MDNQHKTTQKNTFRVYPFLLRGDLKKVANQLNCHPQKVRNYVRGTVNEKRIGITLEKLNKKRQEKAEQAAKKAVTQIIKDND